MFYEERMVGGRLQFRTSPDGKWEVAPIEKAWDKIILLQDRIFFLEKTMRTANSMFSEYI